LTSAWVLVFLVQSYMGVSSSRSDARSDWLACLSLSRSAWLMLSLKSIWKRAYASSLSPSSFVTQIRHDAATTQAQAEAVIALATDHSVPFWAAAGAILRGWALTKQGQAEVGMAQMQEGLRGWQAMGAALMRTYGLGLLADAYVHTGRSHAGLPLLEEALADVQTRGERLCAAPLYRLQGELLQQTAGGRPQAKAEAEGCFLHAIAVAHRQKARALELRAATSLARLWQRQGKSHAARHMLAAIYRWFTEGFEATPLPEAQTLLNALACKRRS
jgi:predicted ATPase